MEALKAENPMNLNVAFNVNFLPDSIPNDSIEEQTYEFGDTVSIVIDGADTVYTIYTDTSSNFWLIDPFAIYVTPSGEPNVVNPDMFGVNVSSMFQHAPESENVKYTDTKDPWTLLTELKPKVLRFPDGSGGKFSRLLGSQNLDPDSEDYLKWNGGYGFNLDEIISYYDYTDGVMSVPEKEVDDLISEYLAGTLDLSWIEAQDQEDFKTLLVQYYEEQPTYDPSLPAFDTYEEQPLFINEFIRLVKQIEEQDPENEDDDYRLDVVLCLDIINETAQRNLEIIDYLVNQHGINVVGIELGNEVYSKFYGRSMGFKNSGLGGTPKSAFSFYWDYIHGLDYPIYFDLTNVLPPAMLATDAHDFIGVLNAVSGFADIGYGIPAENLHTSGAPFKTIEDINVTGGGGGALPEWNEDLYNHYESDDDLNDDLDFDAVILHPYYTPKSNGVGANENWREIPLCLDYDPGTVGIYDDYTDLWNYAIYDEALRCAFDNIIGIGGATGNFRDLIKTRHKQNYIGQNSVLHFDEFEAKGKRLWTTESNLLDVEKGAAEDLQMRLSVYTNSFAHSFLLQEWNLKNIKMNYYPEFVNPNFYTISTWQNFVGGSTIDFLYASDKQDQIELGVLPNELGDLTGCDEDKIDEYFVQRTTYHTMKLLSEISANSLDYLSNSATLVVGVMNLAPSIFIDQERENMYVYFTNIKSTQQKYVINPANLLAFYPYADAVRLDLYPIEIFAIDAEQLYSNSGRNSLFGISTAYDPCQEIGVYENRYEIIDISSSTTTSSCAGSAPPGAACVLVPGYSAGYFKLKLSPFELKLGEMENVFTLFPNPTSTSFTFMSDAFLEIQDYYKMTILDITGKLLLDQQVMEGQSIDVSNFPVGIYTVLIYNGYNNVEVEKLIKMQ
ncbi:MAG: T9SS type A sorting domain-containing protein [Bacteroidetes bacterium]|nr:T9SS type A sorting domain-containing protein [Bacteroidota bacterium]MBK8345035.1 T9SS type A sorting domain-containing protein [Bacteroidota bacterium]